MGYRKDSIWKAVDWWTIGLYLILLVCGWFSVCGASYDYGEPNFLDFGTRAGKQLMWMGCSLCLGFVLLMLEDKFYDTYAYLIYGILLLLLFGTILIRTKSRVPDPGLFSVQSACSRLNLPSSLRLWLWPSLWGSIRSR